MSPIPYKSRMYVPPPIDPDDAGPISISASQSDLALVVAQDATKNYVPVQYIYERAVEIKVTTAKPSEIPAAKGQTKSSTRFTIEVKTKDKSVSNMEIVMSWFPYSFDWESDSAFKGHHNRSKAEGDKTLCRIADDEITFEEYCRDKPFRDVLQGNSCYLTANFPDAKRSDERIWSQYRQHAGDELMAFGICKNVDEIVDEIFREEAMLRLFSHVDETILLRYWKDYSHFTDRPKPTRIRGDLLDNEIIERLLRSAIRKAVVGPINNQKSFIGKPVSLWATSVFLRELYNLNRRNNTPTPVTSAAAARRDSQSQEVTPLQRPDFMLEVAIYTQELSENSELDLKTLKARGIQDLTATDPGARTPALALLMALPAKYKRDESLCQQVRHLADHDDDSFVRENAAKALDNFADS